MTRTAPQPADALVIFGITGDLAQKMTFAAPYRLEAAGRLKCPIIGVAHDDWSHDHLVASMQTAVQGDGPLDEKAFDRPAGRFCYLQGDFADPATYDQLGRLLKDAAAPLFYLEIPPALFAPGKTAAPTRSPPPGVPGDHQRQTSSCEAILPGTSRGFPNRSKTADDRTPTRKPGPTDRSGPPGQPRPEEKRR